MSQGTPDSLTDQHLILFGTIVQSFARHEVLLQEIMATVSGADVTSIKLLTGSLSFTEMRNALFNLLRHRAVPLDRIDAVRRYVKVLHTFMPLRNDIAHSIWVEGRPQNSVWPLWLSSGPLAAVKPVHDIGGDDKDFIEGDEDRVTYTIETLRDISNALDRNYGSFRAYAAGSGLIPQSEEIRSS